MAEAVVEEPLGFFCHRCWMEIRPVLPSYLCPHCASGFIEELDSTQPEQLAEQENHDDISLVFEPESPFLVHVTRRPRGQRWDGGQRMGFLRGERSDAAFRRGLDAIRDQIAELERVDFYSRDYAWNREGLDAIVTHLLNQMDVSGPPPLAKERIDQIPVVTIVQQQVAANLQCPVCWEDFRLEESVRKLMCDHYFHENCIIPWLELHGTCPVCRKWLFEENSESSTDDLAMDDTSDRSGQHASNLATQLESLLSGNSPMVIDSSDEPGTSTISHEMG